MIMEFPASTGDSPSLEWISWKKKKKENPLFSEITLSYNWTTKVPSIAACCRAPRRCLHQFCFAAESCRAHVDPQANTRTPILVSHSIIQSPAVTAQHILRHWPGTELLRANCFTISSVIPSKVAPPQPAKSTSRCSFAVLTKSRASHQTDANGQVSGTKPNKKYNLSSC